MSRSAQTHPQESPGPSPEKPGEEARGQDQEAASKTDVRNRRIQIWRDEVARLGIAPCACAYAPMPISSIRLCLASGCSASSRDLLRNRSVPADTEETSILEPEMPQRKRKRRREKKENAGVWMRVKQLARKCRGKDAVSSPRGELEPPHLAEMKSRDDIVTTEMYKSEGEGKDQDEFDEGSSTEHTGVGRVIVARQARLQRAEKLLAKLNSSREDPSGREDKIRTG